MTYREVNFDGLIGPTHNYSGLSFGNLASARNAKLASNPKAAAQQGLKKMRHLMSLGYTQGFLPPQLRPNVGYLRSLGFAGSDKDIITQLGNTQPELLSLVYSASPMWAANAATVSPAPDTADGKVHFTPANLLTTPHRAIEAGATAKALRAIFSDPDYFTVHDPLPANSPFADEGAANHSRLCSSYADEGIGMFVYGRQGFDQGDNPQRFPARQTRLACEAVARSHGLPDERAVYCRQHPTAIDAGAFHNDVVAVANGPLLFFHQLAYPQGDLEQLKQSISRQIDLQLLAVSHKDVPLEDAIGSYLFNSQLLAGPDGDMQAMRLIAPGESAENTSVRRFLDNLVEDHNQPIRAVDFVDVRQSMSNGGGPACLRLRVVLNDQQLQAVNPAFILDEERIAQLEEWVQQHYRDELFPEDLADPDLYDEVRSALEVLSGMLGLQDFYQC